MRFSVILTLGLAGILLHAPASAADWQYATTSNNNIDFYVDTQRIRVVGAYRYYWVKTNTNQKAGSKYDTDLRFNKANCETWSNLLLSFIEYDASGNRINSMNIPESYGNRDLQPVAPDTIGDTILKLVCR